MEKDELIIVGIGASAGGLEALQGFVKNLPKDKNIAYVLAQHLSPTYKSIMVDLLLKDSTINIVEAHNYQKIEANTMYICPPNKNIVVEENNTLLIVDPKQLTYGPKPSINILFESIANTKGSKSIGIILSGTGSDGSRGIRAIKAEGGFTIVQQPQNAKYDGMPNSAINTGNIDLILDVEIMGEEIVELLKYPNKAESLNNLNEKTITYKNILSKINSIKNVDFSLYKVSTIQRRIERRMAALKLTKLNDYYEYLMKSKNNEINTLFNDILIGVTSFFRDEEAFLALKDTLEESLLNKEKKKKNIRVWIPGCSTGEEVYTIAMIISELLGKEIVEYKIQIFATDIDEEALKFARTGRYPESSLIEVDRNYVKKYFAIKNEEYEVIKPIRDMCIFSRHDIIKDPAFLKLDLISCRNLLIYFSSELQNKIFPIFHYSLNDNGLLFLGKSEAIGNFNHQFTLLDKKAKIFKSAFIGQKRAPSPVRSIKNMYQYPKDTSPVVNIPTISDMMMDYIQRHIIPNCVVVNDSFDIVYIKGSNSYLVRPEGEITQNIFKNVLPTLSIELRSCLHQCKTDGKLLKSQFKKVILDKEQKYLRFIVTPLDNPLTSNLFLICFQEEELDNLINYDFEIPGKDKEGQDSKVTQLEIELVKMREHLQTVIEELETSNEEIQSLNEELQSSNEELQSSNEELETTNEELQSTNEELQTAYAEISSMYEERSKEVIKYEETKINYDDVKFRSDMVLKHQKIGILDLDIINNKVLYVNDIWADILSFSTSEIKKIDEPFDKWILNRIHEENHENEKKNFEDMLLSKIESYSSQVSILDKNNQYVKVNTSIVAQIEKNRTVRVLFIYTKI